VVTTSEEARCKYGLTTDYAQMEKFPDFDDITKAYKTSTTTPTIKLEKDVKYTYNMLCEDRGGSLSALYTLDVTFMPDAHIIISELAPAITNNKRPIISLKTDTNAKCTIDNVYSGITGPILDLIDPPKEMFTSDGKAHHYPDTGDEWGSDLTDGVDYNFDISCKETGITGRQPATVTHKLIVDTVQPAKPVITSPLDNALVPAEIITVIGIVTEPELTVKLLSNGEEKAVITPDKLVQIEEEKYQFSTDISVVPLENRISASAIDMAGNTQSSDIVTVKSISTIPLEYVNPQGTQREVQKITVGFKLETGVIIDFGKSIIKLTRAYNNNDGNLQTEDIVIDSMLLENKYTIEITPKDIEKLPDGKYTLELNVFDSLGNNQIHLAEFGVNSIAPSIIIVSPEFEGIYITNQDRITVKARAEDNQNQIIRFSLSLDQSVIEEITSPSNSIEIDKELTLIDDEEFEVKLTAVNSIADTELENTAETIFKIRLDKTVDGGEITIE